MPKSILDCWPSVAKTSDTVFLLKVWKMSEISFEAKIGETYFEYEREDGTRFLSIITPSEWDFNKYHLKFIGKVVWK